MHLVDALEFDLSLDSEVQAFALQSSAQAFLRGPALRVIDEVFGALSRGDEVWRFERLELDLGTVSGDDLPAQWARRLRERLWEALPALQAEAASAPERRPRSAESALSALLHFLHHGRLPWYGPSLPAGGFAAWATTVAVAQAPALAAALRAPGAGVARERALCQLPAAALAALAGALGPALPLDRWIDEGLDRRDPAARERRAQPLWAAAVAALLRPGGTDARGLWSTLRRASGPRDAETPRQGVAALVQAVRRGQAAGLEAHLRAALHDDPQALARWLRQPGRRSAARRRWLVLALPTASTLALLQVLAPRVQPLLVALLRRADFGAVWRGDGGQPWSALQRRLLRAALDALVDDAHADPSPIRWLDGLLRRMADGRNPAALALALQARAAGALAQALQDWRAAQGGDGGLAAAWQRAAPALARGELPAAAGDLALLLARDRAGLRQALLALRHDPVRARRLAAAAAAVAGPAGDACLHLLAGPDAGFAATLLHPAARIALPVDAGLQRRCLFEALLAEAPGLPDRRRWLQRWLRGLAVAQGLPPAALQQQLGRARAALPLSAATAQALRQLVPAAASRSPRVPPLPPPAKPVHTLARLLEPRRAGTGAAELGAWHALLDRRDPSLLATLRRALADARTALGLVRRLPAVLLQRLLRRLRPGQAAPRADAPADDWVARLQGRPPAPPPRPPVLDQTAPLALDNAGLVLLAPYLPRWFALLGLALDQHFVSLPAAQRAVLLLQWLVDGRAESDETRLALPRLLCGLPFEQPLPRAIVLEAREVESGQQLLQAVISHWGALGQTTPAGLRETFLQREGRLQRDGEAWRLQVLPRAFDLLLDRLPWGWRTLKLATMERVLHVDCR